MKTLMKLLGLVALALFFTACGGGGSGGGVAASPTLAQPNIQLPVVAPIVAPVSASLTYYKYTKTVAPFGGWPTKTYTATGSCISYNSKEYCWDDGLKTVVIPATGTYHYTYWGLDPENGSWGPCSGGCLGDIMTTPIFLSTAISANINMVNVNQVFNSGVPVTETCTETDSTVTCQTFSIDLTQPSL